ncbi:MAG: VCBS domain-containing protein, partial [Gammaproteobacteria bacterium]|nr:VCBS domain-containing protein [Gammaproteobacteria bacterium]
VITVTVSDGINSSIETFTVTVNPVSDAAVFGGVDSGIVSEDTGVVAGNLTASGTSTVSDPDSGESSFIAGTLSGTYGLLTIDTAGNWSYAADNSQAAIQGLGVAESLTDVVTITSLDGTTHDINVTITGVNDAPVINDDSYSVITGSTLNMLTTGVLANDYDIDGDALIATLITGPGNGALTLNADGTFSYASDANFIGNDSFTYQVSDGNGGIATNTVTLTVSNLPETIPGTDNNADGATTTEAEPTVDIGTLITPDTLSTAPDPGSELLYINSTEINFTVNAVDSIQEITDGSTKGKIQGVNDYYRDRLYEVHDDRFDRTHVSLAQHTFEKAYDTVSDLQIRILEMLSEYKLEIVNRHETNMPIMQLLSKYAGGASLSLSAGILTWALRGGALAATMMSSMPIWKGFDPLPVLAAARKKYKKAADTTMDDDKNDLIDEMFESSGKSTRETRNTRHD